MTYQEQSYTHTAATIIKKLQKRNMEGFYCSSKDEAVKKILDLIPAASQVTWGGSETLIETGIMKALQTSDYQLIDRHSAATPQEKREIYGKIVTADYFLTGTNAITLNGELINVDGAGNRVACLITGPQHVIVVTGMNKVVTTIEEGMRRARNIAAPPNSIRVGADTPCSKIGMCADCLTDDCICSHTVITRRSLIPGRVKVILIGGNYGF